MNVNINLTLNEVEVILLLWGSHEQQQLGMFADNARKKLLAARAELRDGKIEVDESTQNILDFA